jgi:WD40 repeat protein
MGQGSPPRVEPLKRVNMPARRSTVVIIVFILIVLAAALAVVLQETLFHGGEVSAPEPLETSGAKSANSAVGDLDSVFIEGNDGQIKRQIRPFSAAMKACLSGKEPVAPELVWQVKYGYYLSNLAYYPDKQLLAVTELSGTNLLDLSNGQERHIYAGGSQSVLTPDGDILITPDTAGQVLLWDASTGETLRTLQHTCKDGCLTNEMALNPAGTLLAVGTSEGEIHLWEIPGGKLLHVLSGHADVLGSLAISPDGKLLVSAAADSTVRFWDLATAQQTKVIKLGDLTVWRVLFTPTGRVLVAGGSDGQIHSWRFPSAEQLPSLNADLKSPKSIALSRDGKLLATTHEDDVAKVWQLETGKLLGRFEHTLKKDEMLSALSFINNGSILVSTSTGVDAFFWCLPKAD